MRLEPPPHLQKLLDAYVSATNLPVSLSCQRAHMLTDLHNRGITAEDVTAVLNAVKRKIERGDGGFTEASLDFRNAMNPDTLEERALLLRQQAARKKKRLVKAETVTHTMADGSTVSVLTSNSDSQPPKLVDMAAFKAGIRDLERQVGR